MSLDIKVTIHFSDSVKQLFGALIGALNGKPSEKSSAKTEAPEVKVSKDTTEAAPPSTPEHVEVEDVTGEDQKKLLRKSQLAYAERLGIKNPNKVGYEALAVRIEKFEKKAAEAGGDSAGAETKPDAKAETKSSVKIEDVRAFIQKAQKAGTLTTAEAIKAVAQVSGPGKKLKDVEDAKLETVLQYIQEIVEKNSGAGGADDEDI